MGRGERDRSLIMRKRGGYNTVGGGSEVLPLRKGGKAEKVLAILKWGRNKFPPIKKRAHKVLTYLEGRGGGGGGKKVSFP